MASRGRIALGVAVVAGIVAARVATQPKYWSNPVVYSWLRKQLPFGTDRREVREFLSGHGWLDSVAPAPLHDGCRYPEIPPPPDISEFRLRADLGNAWLLLGMNTEAFFAFDSTAHLTAMCVRSSTDAL